MDSFIKVIPQKKSIPPTLHMNEIKILEKYIHDGENVFICDLLAVEKVLS